MDAGRIILRGNSRLLKPAITEILAMYQLIQAQEFPIYGVPITGFQSQFQFKPQVMMYFLQNKSEALEGRKRVDAEISFRLMPYESNTITQAYVNQLATTIKTKFATGQPFTWRKGKKLYSYCDDRKGYRLGLLTPDETEARRIIEQTLDIQGHSPEWEYLNENSSPQEATKYPEVPGNQIILGKTVKKPRRRPIVNAVFQYALLHLHGLSHPVCLVDRSNRFPDALEVA